MASRLIEKTVGPTRLVGFSMAGEETVIILPEMNVAFDVGRAPRELINIDYVCLSHGHMDHSAGLAYYFSQRNFQGLPPGCVIAQHRLVPAVQELMQVYARIEGHLSPAKIIGVDEDEDVPIRRDLVVRPFRVRHAGLSLGFSVIEVRKKLRPELAELSGQQIAELKKKGESVEYRLEIPRVAFCADSAVGDYLNHPHVRDAEVLIVECTFFEGEHIDRANLGQHTHVKDLPELLQRVNSQHVVISHITRRTPLAEAKRRLAEVLTPAELQRLTILMDRPPRVRRGPEVAGEQGADQVEK
jgi:ribonuclease Z